jgi:hypothetical protein
MHLSRCAIVQALMGPNLIVLVKIVIETPAQIGHVFIAPYIDVFVLVNLHAIMYQDFAANMHHHFAANVYQSFAAKGYQ